MNTPTTKQLPVGTLVKVLPVAKTRVDGKIGILISNAELYHQVHKRVLRFTYCIVLIDDKQWEFNESELEELTQ